MEEIQKQVIRIALKKTLTKSYCSISDSDSCLKLSKIIPDKEDYNTMRVLHCVDYSDMTKDVQEWLLKAVENMFCGSGFDLSFLETKEEVKTNTIEAEIIKEIPVRKGFLRLLG